MEWGLDFISEKNFTNHVAATIESMVKSWSLLILSVLIRILLIQSN